jgi:toxin FitB
VLWLLDTCVVSEPFKKIPHEKVLQWLTHNAVHAALPSVVLGEIFYGMERMPAGRNRNELQLWAETLASRFVGRTLQTDDAVWRVFARLKASVESIGRSQHDLDLLIAATASVHQLTVVTRNTKHFVDTGVKTLNPWLVE